MDRNAFKQIKLSTSDKIRIVAAWMRFVRSTELPVARDQKTELRFIQQSHEQVIARLRNSDEWLQEHVARLFWTCIDMGLMEYQYPYPHNGQSYSPTRIGRIVGAVPDWIAFGILRSIVVFDAMAGPIKHFAKIRNVVALVTALVGWYGNPHVQATTLVIASAVMGVVSTWVAYFLTSTGE